MEIWISVSIIYTLFIAWYKNWRGPLRKEEIDHYFTLIENTDDTSTDTDALRKFLEADDGKEFIMMNTIRIQPELTPHPDTQKPTEPRDILEEYLKGFMPAFLKRAGHPVMQLRKTGPYIDSWNTGADPDWSAVGLMRYRSRRDLMDITTDPRFLNAHVYKHASIERAMTFPSTTIISLYPNPLVSVGVILAFIASLLS